MKQKQKYTLFYSYAPADREYRDQLSTHLSPLKRDGLIEEWYDQQILAGSDRIQDIIRALHSADLILLLISADFLESHTQYEIEMRQALERHDRGEARVIPILVRPCNWQHSPFAHLQYLPHNGKPIRSWDNRDEAFYTIAQELRRIIVEEQRPRLPLSGVQRQNRERLLKKVQDTWIKGLLERPLHQDVLIDLHLQELPDMLVNPWHLEVQELDQTPHPLPVGTSIAEIYNEAKGELLILGEAGSGKTTLLLELARTLLERAKEDEQQPMPIVFNLSSWAQKRQALRTWLVEELRTKYSVGHKVGQDWIDAGQVLPLLDGLDEVMPKARAACVQEINTYYLSCCNKNGNCPIVVCCRSREYVALPNRIMLWSAVGILPLTDEQINRDLEQAGERGAMLKQALKEDSELHSLARQPLMLSVLMGAYQDSSLEEIEEGTSVPRQDQIFAKYTEQMLRRRRAEARYRPQQTTHWLSYLAGQMRRQNQTIFYVEYMQPAWLMKKGQRRLYHGLTTGPICGLLIGLSSIGTLRSFLFTFLITTLLVGVFFGWLSEPEIEQQETKTIKRMWIRMQQSLAAALENRLVVGIIACLAFATSVALYSYLVDYPNQSFDSKITQALSAGMLNGVYR